jgi:hypothetical protein
VRKETSLHFSEKKVNKTEKQSRHLLVILAFKSLFGREAEQKGIHYVSCLETEEQLS